VIRRRRARPQRMRDAHSVRVTEAGETEEKRLGPSSRFAFSRQSPIWC
jgi:hypothetical protein